MNLLFSPKSILSAAITAAICVPGLSLTSCSDEVITPDRDELYSREFVKQFGTPDASHHWSEARSKAISIITPKSTSVTVLADVEGSRYMFARVTCKEGINPVIVNVPQSVETLILCTDDGYEFPVKVGTVVDLGEKISRASASAENNDNQSVSYNTEDVRQIDWLKYEGINVLLFGDIRPGKYDRDYIGNDILYNVRYYGSSMREEEYYNIYPIYWRENRYGETDYLLGAYFRNSADGEITMIDFEGFDLKDKTFYSTSGNTPQWQKAETGAKQAFDPTLISNKNFRLRTMGMQAKAKNINSSQSKLLGFYLKSGLEEGYTEGKGRNAKHIVFTESRYNREFWGEDNYHDVEIEYAHLAYCGVAAKTNQGFNGRTQPTQVILDESYAGEKENGALVLGFGPMPEGKAMKSDLDFCDVVITITHNTAGAGKPQSHRTLAYPAYPWYLAAEDLGGSYDWDFNDLVVNIYDITTDLSVNSGGGKAWPLPFDNTRRIIVKPRAAGGTLPVYLMYEGKTARASLNGSYLSEIDTDFNEGCYVVGTEIHHWLQGDNYKTPLNVDGTDFSYEGRAVSFAIPHNYEAFDWTNPPSDLGAANSTMHGFWVLVDPANNLRLYEKTGFDPAITAEYVEIALNDGTKHRQEVEIIDNVLTPFNGHVGEGAYRIDSPSQDKSKIAPQMILTHRSWHWPREGVSMAVAWPRFTDWVKDQTVSWSSDEYDTGLYQAESVCSGELPEMFK